MAIVFIFWKQFLLCLDHHGFQRKYWSSQRLVMKAIALKREGRSQSRGTHHHRLFRATGLDCLKPLQKYRLAAAEVARNSKPVELLQQVPWVEERYQLLALMSLWRNAGSGHYCCCYCC